jgi:metal-sulfur cluster biosynthetic enzyme
MKTNKALKLIKEILILGNELQDKQNKKQPIPEYKKEKSLFERVKEVVSPENLFVINELGEKIKIGLSYTSGYDVVFKPIIEFKKCDAKEDINNHIKETLETLDKKGLTIKTNYDDRK